MWRRCGGVRRSAHVPPGLYSRAPAVGCVANRRRRCSAGRTPAAAWAVRNHRLLRRRRRQVAPQLRCSPTHAVHAHTSRCASAACRCALQGLQRRFCAQLSAPTSRGRVCRSNTLAYSSAVTDSDPKPLSGLRRHTGSIAPEHSCCSLRPAATRTSVRNTLPTNLQAYVSLSALSFPFLAFPLALPPARCARVGRRQRERLVPALRVTLGRRLRGRRSSLSCRSLRGMQHAKSVEEEPYA